MAAVIAERKAQPTGAVEAERRGILDDGLRAFLHKEIRVALDETGAAAPRMAAGPVTVESPVAGGGTAGEGAASGTLAALLTQRVATREEENRRLRERAATAEAASRAAQAEAASAQAALAAARAALAEKEAGLVAALKATTDELARMGERHAAAERRRALETDNVRQAYRAERRN